MNLTIHSVQEPARRFQPAPSGATARPIRTVASRAVAELRSRQPRLAAFGLLLLALLLPMAGAWLFDDRMVQGANVWIKPMKFALSIAVFAFTTAWFVGHLPPARRRGRAVERIVWLVIGSGTFELAYITLQAALGEASHFNVGDPFHFVMYALMGLGATLLTATQPMLAWELYRHPDPARPAAYRQAVLAGLALTFVLGAGVGWLLSGMEPPRDRPGMPLLGWVLTGGDLRPAHFVGVHAAQALPLLGFAVAASRLRDGRPIVWLGTLLYVALFAALVLLGLEGRT